MLLAHWPAKLHWNFLKLVVQRLRELDISIVEEVEGKGKDYSMIQGGDVVIFPAFGATAQEMKYFRDKGVNIVDTTCPWVAKVRGAAWIDPHAQAPTHHGSGLAGLI